MTPLHRARWKLATRQAVTDAGGVEAAAAILRVSIGHVSKYQTGHAPDILTLSGALMLAEHSGTRAFAELFADLAGCRLVDQHDADAAAPTEIAAMMATVSECSEVSHQIAEALRDGSVSPRERGLVLKSVNDLTDALSDIRAALTAGKPA